MVFAYLESIASFIPKADRWIKCFKLYCLQSFAKIDGNKVCIFLNEFPLFSNNIPIKFIQISAPSNNFLILVSSKIFDSIILINPFFSN